MGADAAARYIAQAGPLHTDLSQRWRERCDRYRPSQETIRTSEYDVAAIDETTAKRFVIEHHYAATFPAARFRFGLFRRGALVGVAVFSHPTNERVLAMFPGTTRESTELGRFVLLDDVPGNGESWFLGRAFDELRHIGLVGVLSFSDPVPRTTTAGRLVMPGHVGTIYAAHNGVYLGRGTARLLRLLPDGTVFSDRAASKIRAGERGYRYAMAILERHGADAWDEREPREDWLRRWVPRLTRILRHPGNHRYGWMLPRRRRSFLVPVGPYPKAKDLPVAA